MHKKYSSIFEKDRNITIKRLFLMKNLVREVHGGLRRAYKNKLAAKSNQKDCSLRKKVSVKKVGIY